NGFSSYSRIAQYEAERKSRPNVEANDWFLLRQCKYIGHSWSGREPAVCNYGIPGYFVVFSKAGLPGCPQVET
ncbi:hypothetical protein LTR96_011966, partial [Exophiala xenobiotica]